MVDTYQQQLAVVTGAAGGIGFELARQFAEHGFDLLITADRERIFAAADTLRASGAKVEAVHADLATFEGVEAFCRRIDSMARPVDVVALNAGAGAAGPFVASELADELRTIESNVAALVHLAKRVVRAMVARGEGRVLFTSSNLDDAPTAFEAVCGASKAFLFSFAEALRHELRGSGVVVTALRPAAMETTFARDGLSDALSAGKRQLAELARQGFDALMTGKDHIVSAMTWEKTRIAGRADRDRTRASGEPGSASD